MKKIILYAVLLLASMQESHGMFWHHKDKAVPKGDAALRIKSAIDTILRTKPANTYDRYYDGWVMRDIWRRVEKANCNENVAALNNDLFIVLMGILKDIATKRGAQLSNTSMKPIKLHSNLIAPLSEPPEYSEKKFKETDFYEAYCNKIKKRSETIDKKFATNDISETSADGNNKNKTYLAQATDGTDSADDSEHLTAIDQSCDDDQNGQIVAAIDYATELDQQDQQYKYPFIQTLLNNRLAISGGIAVIAFILYKYKNRIQEFLFPSDTMQVVEAPASTQTEPIPNEEIAQTLEQLKQMLAKKGI